MKIILDENDIKELIKRQYKNITDVIFDIKKGTISAILESNNSEVATDNTVVMTRATPVPTEKKSKSMTSEGVERNLVDLG